MMRILIKYLERKGYLVLKMTKKTVGFDRNGRRYGVFIR